MTNYTIGNIYQGGYSSLSPSYGNIFTGYRVSAGELGAPTKPDTANQIQQVSTLLNQGIVPIEVGALKPEDFDTIPKEHFKEINRMAKLSGAKISVHAPIVEASGIGEQGWSETNRELAERQLSSVVDKAIEMDDKGGMPITIHSSGSIPGIEYKMTPEGKKTERIILVDKESGKPVQALEEEKMFYPEMIKPEIQRQLHQGKITHAELKPEHYIPLDEGKTYTPEERIKIINASQWDNQINQIIFNKERADEILQQNYPQIQHLMESIQKKQISPNSLTPIQGQVLNHINNVQTYLEDTRQHVAGLFNKAYKNTSTKEEKEYLSKISEEFKKDLRKDQSLPGQSMALQNLMTGLKQFTPELYTPIENFALDKSSETFANVAFNAFDKHGKRAPKILIENMFPGMAFSTGKEMNQLIMESKKKFVEKAMNKGYSNSEAARQADKLIGVTLDVGHLNITKKKGFEDKDLIEELKEFSKHVKHVHLTDNFGRSDSHLPPGMGNVPFQDIFEELERVGATDVRKIVEAGGFVQHFGTSPLPYVLEAFSSPMYASGQGPYWNQNLGLYQGYYGGFGAMLPQGHFQTYGIPSFANLPSELGGQRGGGAGSGMSGRPME